MKPCHYISTFLNIIFSSALVFVIAFFLSKYWITFLIRSVSARSRFKGVFGLIFPEFSLSFCYFQILFVIFKYFFPEFKWKKYKSIRFPLIIRRNFDKKMSFHEIFSIRLLKRNAKFILTTALLYGNNF